MKEIFINRLSILLSWFILLWLGFITFANAKDPFVTYSTKGEYFFKEAIYDSKFDHSKKNSPYLLLPYTLVSTAETKGKMPIFYLRGGPGISGTEVARDLKEGKNVPDIYKQLLRKHPIYFIDQRGTGIFKPSMWCDTSKVFKDEKPSSKAEYVELLRKQIKYCKKTHKRFSIHGKFLNNESVAQDIETLRKRIKAKKIILFGESYGTHLAQTYLRDYDKHVHKAIMVGVAGLDDLVFLPKRFEHSIAKLDSFRKDQQTTPLLPKIKNTLHAYSEGTQSLEIARHEFLWYVMDHYNNNSGKDLLNVLINDVNDAVDKYHNDLSYKKGLNYKYFAVICSSYSSRERLELARKQAETSLVGEALIMHYEACDATGIKPLPDKHREPVKTNVPTIAFSGRLDFKTPPEQAEEVSKGFSQFIHVINESGAHNYCNKVECTLELDEFLDAAPQDIKSKTVIVE